MKKAMAFQSSTKRHIARAALLLAYAVAVVFLTFLFLKVLYSTPLGAWTAERIPDAAWRQLDSWFAGPYGESAQDGELVGMGLVSFLAALLVVVGVAWLVRRRSDERGSTQGS